MLNNYRMPIMFLLICLTLSCVMFLNSKYISAQILTTATPVDEFALDKQMVDVQKLEPTIVVDLKYASKDNVFGEKFYSKNIAYLRPKVAERLVKVHRHLKRSGFGLKIWDAYRPFRVQKMMWRLKPDARYVANPTTGSVFNRGAAVAVTLVDSEGKEQEMPTGFDNFTEQAHHSYQGCSWTAIHNRNTLKRAMEKFGLLSVESEWWHYNDIDAGSYEILDIPL